MLLKGAINKFWETCVAIHLHALTITSYNTTISVNNAHDIAWVASVWNRGVGDRRKTKERYFACAKLG